MYTYAFPAFDEGMLAQRGFTGFGAPANADISYWSTTASMADYAVARAFTAAAGNSNVASILMGARQHTKEALSVINYQRSQNIWTHVGEEAVIEHLTKAKGLFDTALGLGATTPPFVRFPLNFPAIMPGAAGPPVGSAPTYQPTATPSYVPPPPDTGLPETRPVLARIGYLLNAMPPIAWIGVGALGLGVALVFFRR